MASIFFFYSNGEPLIHIQRTAVDSIGKIAIDACKMRLHQSIIRCIHQIVANEYWKPPYDRGATMNFTLPSRAPIRYQLFIEIVACFIQKFKMYRWKLYIDQKERSIHNCIDISNTEQLECEYNDVFSFAPILEE